MILTTLNKILDDSTNATVGHTMQMRIENNEFVLNPIQGSILFIDVTKELVTLMLDSGERLVVSTDFVWLDKSFMMGEAMTAMLREYDRQYALGYRVRGVR